MSRRLPTSARPRSLSAAGSPALRAAGDEARAGEIRGDHILRALLHHGSVSVAALAAELRVTPMTVRRDLEALERRGLLRRTHGGAVAIQPLLYEPFRHEPTFTEQESRYVEEKRRIALAAAELVRDGDTLAFTPGTTTTQVTRTLHARRDLTVITPTVNVAMELSARDDVTVFVTGGYLRGSWFSLAGAAAEAAAAQLFADTLFLSARGVHAERGLTGMLPEAAALTRVLVRQARRRVVLADRSKLGRVEQALVCPIRDVHELITDREATDEQVAPFEAVGVAVRRV